MTTPITSKRSLGQRALTSIFGFLALGFFVRAMLYGAKWMRHVVEGDRNFKALTIWCVIYMLVCAAIALVAFRFPREEAASGPRS